ncbi:MAG TPA: tripartite tricarboxylate transporter substrate binding protein [Xanthobacteraceae bacterium]|nr:tripartite tricarboxylate transporter substrate binding protein [Xanthobacteraceae bacterium]
MCGRQFFIAARIFLSAIVAAGVSAFAAGVATAQPYPARPIKMVVPFPPGGADVMARLVAEPLSVALGQPVIAENRGGGGGGTVGAKSVAGADADGHTLLFTSPGPLTTSAAVYRNLDYDPVRSFVPVAMIATSPFVLVVHPNVPATSVKEFVTYAKANPGRISYASVGYGTLPHLFFELFKQRTGIEMVHVPYRGSAPAITDLLAGQVQLYIDNTRNIASFIRAGRLKALAVTSEARTPDLPELPTIGESGHGEFLATYWNGVLAPAGTPPPIVEKLNAAINANLQTAETRASVAKLGMAPKIATTREFGALIATEFEKWLAVAKAADIKVE